MRVKIFAETWGVKLDVLENEVNEFLKRLPTSAVLHVQTVATATRTGPETDQMETDYVISVWYNEDFLGQAN
jgi:hypothetical protein